MKYRNIVIAGDVGTGTTTLAKSLSQKFNFKYLSAGDFFRQYALNHKIPLWDKELVPDEIDREIDTKFAEEMEKGKGIVFDSHYGAWFAKDLGDVFKVLLTCNPKIAEQRIVERDHTHQETVEEVQKRRAGIIAKFKKLYSQENHENPKLFDLVIDTTNSTQEETLEIALENINSK